MQELIKELQQLRNSLEESMDQLHIADKQAELARLMESSQSPDFWQDNLRAQEVMKRQSNLHEQIDPWIVIKKDIDDLGELAKLGDTGITDELKQQLAIIESRMEDLKKQLRFSGPNDEHNAIVSIFAGAGGTDAQDWAKMLLRMYVRWAEKSKFQVRIIDESPGEEAGIKSVTLEIDGTMVYGKLQSEHGVHRLVRLSPFNSDHLRQTSFAKVEVLPKIDNSEELEIDEKDLKIDVFRSGGHGGQSVNTTDSAVRVTHLPTGIVVTIQNERSQLQNKETALTILRSKLLQLQLEQHKDRLSELKGPNTSAEWGNQIRSYVLHPYKQVKDLRSLYTTSEVESVLDGDLDFLIDAYLEHVLGKPK